MTDPVRASADTVAFAQAVHTGWHGLAVQQPRCREQSCAAFFSVVRGGCTEPILQRPRQRKSTADPLRLSASCTHQQVG